MNCSYLDSIPILHTFTHITYNTHLLHIYIDLIQVFVEALDKCFENVCELDLIFHSDKVNYILDEIIMAGMVSYYWYFAYLFSIVVYNILYIFTILWRILLSI